MSVVFLGTGSDLPATVVTNDDIERTAGDYDRARAGVSLHEWTMARTGVAERHRVGPGEGTSDMALRAARRALQDAGVAVDEIDLIVFSTFTSDYRLPGSGALLARALGSHAKVFQIEAACAGFVDAVILAQNLMPALGQRTALVVSAEAMSVIVDDQKFMHQTIFGDGAGAAVLRLEPDSPYGVQAATTHTDAEHCGWTFAPSGGTKAPVTPEVLRDRSQFLQLAHHEVFAFAVDKMVDATHEVLARAGLTIDDVDWLIPHQTGRNIIDAVTEQLKIPPERVVVVIDHIGNVSGATLPIALDEARRQGRLRNGDTIVMTAVGAGMAWGALVVVWRDPDLATALHLA